MSLCRSIVDALLAWINSLRVHDPVEHLTQLVDGTVLIKVVQKISGNEEGKEILHQPFPERFQFISSFLARHCRYGTTTECMLDWQGFLKGVPSELELCKVITLLLYYSTMSSIRPVEIQELDFNIQAELASILRFMVENIDNLCLNDTLTNFLKKEALLSSSYGTVDTIMDEELSPVIRRREPEVRFIDLHKIASTSFVKNSPSSPINDVFHTPQFRLHRLKKQLTDERALRDELELELSENRKCLTEKESQILLLQQRIERLTSLCEKQADQQEPTELEELRERNESLLIRLRDVQKQCQGLKTDKSQNERKIDELLEEKGDLSYKVRETENRLTRTKGELNDISDEYAKAHHEWKLKEKQMESDLVIALDEKRGLEEYILILQGKISLLEDQLEKMAECATQEKGEVMGDILKVQMHTLEALKQEVVELTVKVKELQDKISLLEQEKALLQAELLSEKTKFDAEKSELADILAKLQTSFSEMTVQKEKLEHDARAQEERLTTQINHLDFEMSRLNACLLQKDQEVEGLIHQVEEERRLKGQLVEDYQKQEEAAKESIQALSLQVDSLNETLKHTEGELVVCTQKMENEACQVARLKEEHERVLGERDSVKLEYNEYKNIKDTEFGALSQEIKNLEDLSRTCKADAEELKKEKAELSQKVQELDSTILDLIGKCQNLDAEHEAQCKLHVDSIESLKSQLIEQETLLNVYKNKLAHNESLNEENVQLKSQLLSTEENIKNLQSQLQTERMTYADCLEERGKKLSELESQILMLSHQRDQAQEDLSEEKKKLEKMEAQMMQLEETHHDKNLKLQLEISQMSAIITDKEAECEKLINEVSSWRKHCEEVRQGEAKSVSQMDDHIKMLKDEHEKVSHELQAERAKLAEFEGHTTQMNAEQHEKFVLLQSDLFKANVLLQEKVSEERRLRDLVQSLQEKLEMDQVARVEHVSKLEKELQKMTENLDSTSKELSDHKLKKTELEISLKQLGEESAERMNILDSNLLMVKEKELVAEKLSCELQQLQVRMKEIQQKHENEIAHWDQEIKQLIEEKGNLMADLDTEKASKVSVVARMDQSIQELKMELSTLQSELSRSVQLVNEREGQLKEITDETAIKKEECRLMQENVNFLQEEVVAMKVLKEQLSKQENEIDNYRKAADASITEVNSLKVLVTDKEKEIELLRQNICEKAQEMDSLQSLQQEKLSDLVALHSKVNELESKCREQQGAIATLQNEVVQANQVASEKTSAAEQQQNRLHALEADLICRDKAIKQLTEDKDHIMADLSTERASKVALVTQLEQTIQEQTAELATLQSKLSHSSQLINEKEGQLNKIVEETTSKREELRAQHETVTFLQEEVAALKALKEQVSKQENEIQNYKAAAVESTTEINSLQVSIADKEKKIEVLEQNIREKAQEIETSQNLQQQNLNDIAALHSKVKELESKCREQQEVITALQKEASQANQVASEKAHAAECQQDSLRALETEVLSQKENNSMLEGLLEASRVAQSELESTIKSLKAEVSDKIKDLDSSKKVADSVREELLSVQSQAQELQKASDEWKAQVAVSLQEVDEKNKAISTLEQELANYCLRVSEVEEQRARLNHVIDEKSGKNRELEERVCKLELKIAVSASEASTKDLSDLKKQAEQMYVVEGLKRELAAKEAVKVELDHEVNSWKHKTAMKEEQVTSLQQELSSAQHMIEALTEKNLQLEKEVGLSVTQGKVIEDQLKELECLQIEVKKTALEIAEFHSLKERFSQQELLVKTLKAENASIQLQVCRLEQSNHQLFEKNKELLEEISQGKRLLDTDLSIIKVQHAQELEHLQSKLKLEYQKLVDEIKESAQQATKNLEVMTVKYNDAKSKVLDERQRFQEERQKLLSQVELLELSKNEQTKQLEDLNENLSHQEKVSKTQLHKLNVREGELQEEVQHQKKLLVEVQAQLLQKEQAAEHYKAQFEKAKLHYDAKKQQIHELSDELQSKENVREQLQQENVELNSQLEHINKELQFTRLQFKDAEQTCKNLTSQVCSLEAQVAFADRQIRERDRFHISTDTFKSRESPSIAMNTRRHRSKPDVSTDSLDLSDDDALPLNSTRKHGRSQPETASTATVSGSLDSLTCQRLPPKVESLESLYFTPIPNRMQCKLESSIGSLDEFSLDSARKTRSARRRTTQVINITMIKKIEEQEPDSANNSFYSLRSTQSHQSLSQGNARNVSRPKAAASVPALTSLPSQESLGSITSTSSEDNAGHTLLMSLPGYKPTTRSSKRLSLGGSNNGATSRNSFYIGAGQDEPDPLEDFNRIAELQQRNRVCPPHLKTSYPLESRTTVASFRITDEEMKTGDPNETLRRGTMLPSQIQAISSRRMTLEPGISNNITTRNKRPLENTHQGPETPESKKSVNCFPRPMTPKDASRRKVGTLETKKSGNQPQANRRESMAFSILNTPRRIGDSLLRRGLGKKTPTSKNSPRGSSNSSKATSANVTSGRSQQSSMRNSPLRKSPRIASTKSPRIQNKIFDRKLQKNRKA
ncbi:nuclear mitotic apparatus protein 1 isoform X2 [Pleurodeles waltl]|uniref:nuclear mitotic apparatus protein 1 isoform X2 n=1 Tax=Pleurodeles waltl TaxID=8319 RepID=UPI0037095D88